MPDAPSDWPENAASLGSCPCSAESTDSFEASQSGAVEDHVSGSWDRQAASPSSAFVLAASLFDRSEGNTASASKSTPAVTNKGTAARELSKRPSSRRFRRR